MSIYFKFKSSKEFDTVACPGAVIRVLDLKKAIVAKKKLAKGIDLDMVITDAQYGKVYDDENMQLPCNTSVIVKRIPSLGPGKGLLARMKNEAATAAVAMVSQSSVLLSGVAQSPSSAPLTIVAEDLAHDLTGGAPTVEDELVALQLIHKQAEDLSVCFHCVTLGHFIQNSPTNGDTEIDQQEAGKTPREVLESFRQAVNDASEISVGAGKMVVTVAWVLEQLISNPPDHLACPVCKRLMNDAVLIPCCSESAGYECLQSELINNKLTCPLCATPNMSPEKLLPNKVLRRSVEESLRHAREQLVGQRGGGESNGQADG